MGLFIMNEEQAIKFKIAMGAFSDGFIQDVLTFLITLKHKGYTLDDVESYREFKKASDLAEEEKVKAFIAKKGPTKDCPECPAIMLALQVNTGPGNQTGDPSEHTVWLCQNKDCMHTIYNKESIDEILRRGN